MVFPICLLLKEQEIRKKHNLVFLCTEALIWRCSVKIVFLKILQTLQYDACSSIRAAILLKKDSSTGFFLWNLQNFEEHLFRRTFTCHCFCKLSILFRKRAHWKLFQMKLTLMKYCHEWTLRSNPTNIYLFKVNNRIARKRCETCSKSLEQH